MSDESQGGRPQPNPLERHGMPPRVDFRQIAQNAIAGGIFTRDYEAVRLNAANPHLPQHFPESMLEVPYPNGPMVIEKMEEDVPEAVMNRFRKNWVAANRLLLPNDQVLLYFHQRFVAQDVFQSGEMNRLVHEFSPASLTGYFRGDADFKDPSLSFQVEGVDRTTRNRKLFTQAEEKAGVELVAAHPEVALTVLGYQSVVLDYLQTLGREFQALASIPNSGVTHADASNFTRFREQWDTGNFTMELVPAVALYFTLAKQANHTVPDAQLFTQQLFQDAVDFIVANGAFRNFVPVPADVATDGKERINHFLCPAVGTIREQLMDGSLLYRIYGITAQQLASGDRNLVTQARSLRAKATERLAEPQRDALLAQQRALEEAAPTVQIETANKTLQEVVADAISQALAKRKPATFTFAGKSYSLSNENLEDALTLHQSRQRGDMVMELHAGDYLYSALRNAIVQAQLAKRPVYFEFNGIDYRVTPDKVEELIAQQ